MFGLMSVLGACAASVDEDPVPPGSDDPEALAGDSSSAADPAPSPDNQDVADVHYIGRFAHAGQGGAAFAWPGSALLTRFRGTDISIDLAGAAWFDVEIDDRPSSVLITSSGRGVYPLAIGLPPGEHDLRVTRRTEAFVGTSEFYGFVGSPLVATPAPTLAIEMIGDEATAGWGVLGTSGTCGYSEATEAETQAWGALAANDLGAFHTTIAYSGRGISQNFGGSRIDLLPELYERALPDQADSQWSFGDSPQLVVINAGAADFWHGDPGEAFVTDYASFLSQVRKHYPGAWIVVASSVTLNATNRALQLDYLAKAMGAFSATGDVRISLLPLEPQVAADGYGCGYQPSRTTQRKMADQLLQHLEKIGMY